jgi:phthalate 4,5-dioxygenase oxygenase subunit
MPYGFRYVALRKTEVAGTRNARVVPFIVPYGRIIPAPAFQFTVLEVPTDDTQTSTYLVVHGNAPISEDKILELLGLDNADYYDRKTGNFLGSWSNSFGQSRERMLESWTGLRGVEVEDATIALSQGALYDRSKEHLVPADQAVMRVRRVLLDSVRRTIDNKPPLGVGIDLSQVAARDAELQDGAAWQDLVSPNRTPVVA